MKLYRVKDGAIIQDETSSFLFETDWISINIEPIGTLVNVVE